MEETQVTGSSIPVEFAPITAAYGFFYKISSPFEETKSNDKLQQCQIIITKSNDLLEIIDEEVCRIHKLPLTDAKKVVVHHEFNLLRRFLVVLTASKSVFLLDYERLKVLAKYQHIKDVSSEDLLEVGWPKLYLWKCSGENYVVSEKEMLVGVAAEDDRRGKQEAATALSNKLKINMWHAESLQAEREQKQLFVLQKISTFSNLLQHNVILNKDLSSNQEAGVPSTSSAVEKTIKKNPIIRVTQSHSKNTLLQKMDCPNNSTLLEVLSTRQRIIHNKWIICISIINKSLKFLITELQLTLHSSQSPKKLMFETRLLKTVQRRPKSVTQSIPEPEISIEDLDPPVLRPQKRAFFFANCELPDFSSCSNIICNGLISFKVKHLQPNSKMEENLTRQIPFPGIQLCATNLKSVCTDVTSKQTVPGISLDLLAMVASATSHKLMITSLVTPLNQIFQSLANHEDLIKISNLNCFYCVNTTVCDPLHYASFICKQISAHRINLTLYVKSDKQGMLLIHTLRQFLPKDASISPTYEEGSSLPNRSQVEKNLIAKMQESISLITNALNPRIVGENNGLTTYKHKKSTDGNNSKSYDLEQTKGSIELALVQYIKWRSSLHDLQSKLEKLFIQYGY